MKKILSSLIISGLCAANLSYAKEKSNDPEITDLVNFLVSSKFLISSKDGKQVPPSYYIGSATDIDNYFGDYICAPKNTCTVVDSLYTNPFAILGKGLPPQHGTPLENEIAQAQLERTNMKYGANIYDAATWQIALALAAKNGYLDPKQAEGLVDNQLQSISHKDNRATNESFKYGYISSITDPKKAFTFRMIASNFINKDPFVDGKYKEGITWDYNPATVDPQQPADNFEKVSTWSDWKPITGENAWAQLIGPLQAEYLLKDGKIPISSPALTNAMNSLFAFSAMQAGIGAFYYAPEGALGNQGPITPGEISVENNFSVLGGLQILKHILQEMEPTPEVTDSLAKINVMLYGGKTVNGYETVGLLSFLYNGAYNPQKGLFYTHGTAPIPSSQSDWQPDTSDNPGAMAIDINTWGISALGVENVDKWFGANTAKNMWLNQIKPHGGYYQNGELWGVGYTLANQEEQIMSTEWTAGAINALESMIGYYPQQQELKTDLDSMKQGIKKLRNDKYIGSGFDTETPAVNFVSVPKEYGQAYLYASKRFAIPFGWFANTLPSTTSNAWVIMNYFSYNPFQYGGKLPGETYDIPEKKSLSGGALPLAVTVMFNAGNLGQISQLSLSYKLDPLQPNWITASTVSGRQGTANLPAGTALISMAFNNGGWSSACHVSPATNICKDVACSQIYTINTAWSASGIDPCNLT